MDFGTWRVWHESGAWRAWISKPDIWLKRYQNRAAKVQETHSAPTIAMPPPAEAARLAALVRTLMTENDPDAIRTGLAEIAAALDGMAGNGKVEEAA